MVFQLDSYQTDFFRNLVGSIESATTRTDQSHLASSQGRASLTSSAKLSCVSQLLLCRRFGLPCPLSRVYSVLFTVPLSQRQLSLIYCPPVSTFTQFYLLSPCFSVYSCLFTVILFQCVLSFIY